MYHINRSGGGACITVIISSIRTPPFSSFADGLYFPSSARFFLIFLKQQHAIMIITTMSTTPADTVAMIIICSSVNPPSVVVVSASVLSVVLSPLETTLVVVSVNVEMLMNVVLVAIAFAKDH